MTEAFYDTHSMEEGFVKEKPGLLKSLVSSNSIVLDLGCHDGRLADFLSEELGCVVDGADISGEHIQKSKHLKDTWVFDFNDKKWPIDKKSHYDFIILTDVIEHLVETDNCMKQIYKLLKPGGSLVFSTPNIASLGRRLMLLFGKNPYIEISNHREVNLFNAPVVGHIRYFTVPTMKSLAKFHGFEVMRVIPTSFMAGRPIGFIEKLFPNFCWHIFIVARKPL